MSSFLTNLAAWAQIIAIPLAILAIIISIVLFKRSKQRKVLSCIFHPLNYPVEIKAGEALRGDIEIHYRGQPVGNLFLVQVTVRNTGNLPLTEVDFIERVTFTLVEGSEYVREPSIISCKPSDLSIKWYYDEVTQTSKASIVHAGIVLMNPKDEFTVEFTCTGTPQPPRVNAKIIGGELTNTSSKDLLIRRDRKVWLVYITVAMVPASILYWYMHPILYGEPVKFIPYVILIFLTYLFLVPSMIIITKFRFYKYIREHFVKGIGFKKQ